jgi:hypothetical protein
MIQLITLTGLITTFHCNDIYYLNQVPANKELARPTYCEVAIVRESILAKASTKSSCESIIKLCNKKVIK